MNITITLLFRKAIRPIPGCAADPRAGVFRGVDSDTRSAATGCVAASATIVFGSWEAIFLAVFFAAFAGPFAAAFFCAAFFITAGFTALFAASAFFRRYSAHRFRVASTMRFRPAALIFRLGLGVLVAAAGCLAFCAAAACFRWYSAHRCLAASPET